MTRVRDTWWINRETNGIARKVEELPEAPFEQRAIELTTSALGALGEGEPTYVFLAVKCDQCGNVAEIDAAAPALLPGWTTVEAGELCPTCSKTSSCGCGSIGASEPRCPCPHGKPLCGSCTECGRR